MKGLQFKIDGDWAHFKKPETNNNPLSHNLIPKTALIGMIGAVLGIEREKMKSLSLSCLKTCCMVLNC